VLFRNEKCFHKEYRIAKCQELTQLTFQKRRTTGCHELPQTLTRRSSIVAKLETIEFFNYHYMRGCEELYPGDQTIVNESIQVVMGYWFPLKVEKAVGWFARGDCEDGSERLGERFGKAFA
jgi:hypothetical protein